MTFKSSLQSGASTVQIQWPVGSDKTPPAREALAGVGETPATVAVPIARDAKAPTLLAKLRADARHYNYANGKRRWYGHAGFWVGALQRCGHSAEGVRFAPFRFGLRVLHSIVSFPVRCVTHVSIPREAEIGAGFCMHHPQNIIFPSDIVIGCDVTIYQEVTIGRGPLPGFPRIGDRVVLYAGAKVLGGITIGDDCEIGANVVITRDVPPNSVVSVPPARAIPKATIARLRHSRGDDEHDDAKAGS